MKRVLVAGAVVALGDGIVLGTALALGATTTAIVAAVVGIVGAFVVAMLTPPRRAAAARPATVTLGLPVREPETQPEAASAGDEDAPTPVGTTPSPVAA